MKWVTEVEVGGRTEKSVLIALANFHQEKTGDCFPSIETISTFLEMNRKTVMPALDRLKEMGFIDFDKGARKHRKYTLNFDALSPKGGTKEKRDYSSNLGTKGDALKSQNEPPNSPNAGTKEPDLKVPKQDSYSPKTDVLKSQGLDHKQDNGINRDTPLVVPPDESQPDLLNGTNRFIAAEIQTPPEINREAWLVFCEHRKRIRKPINEYGARLTIAELSKYSPEVQMLAAHESAKNGWQGIFPEKIRPPAGQGTRGTSLQQDLQDTSWAD